MRHVPGREELALLDIDRAPGLRGGDQQVGLAAEKGGNLEHVHRLGDRRALVLAVHVGEHRATVGGAQFGEHRQGGIHPDAARGAQARAVRLVERRLVDQPDSRVGGDFGERAAHVVGVAGAFHLARPGDQDQRAPRADAQAADHYFARRSHTSRDRSTAAATNDANSGCGANGRDFSSGWNCTPMNHG